MQIEIVITDEFGSASTSYSIVKTELQTKNIKNRPSRPHLIINLNKFNDEVLEDASDNKPSLTLDNQPGYYNQAANKLTLYFSISQLNDFLSALTTYQDLFTGEFPVSALSITDLFLLLEESK
jgi:hypothetical protein